MRRYELVLVLKSSLSDTQRKKLLDSIKTWLGKAKVVKEDAWGQKPLSYPIKHEIAGYYLDYSLETQENIPSDFETRLQNASEVLRHILLRKK